MFQCVIDNETNNTASQEIDIPFDMKDLKDLQDMTHIEGAEYISKHVDVVYRWTIKKFKKYFEP